MYSQILAKLFFEVLSCLFSTFVFFFSGELQFHTVMVLLLLFTVILFSSRNFLKGFNKFEFSSFGAEQNFVFRKLEQICENSNSRHALAVHYIIILIRKEAECPRFISILTNSRMPRSFVFFSDLAIRITLQCYTTRIVNNSVLWFVMPQTFSSFGALLPIK